MPRDSKESNAQGNDSGTPRVTARRAAREKLRTDETKMSVLERHMLMHGLQRYVKGCSRHTSAKFAFSAHLFLIWNE